MATLVALIGVVYPIVVVGGKALIHLTSMYVVSNKRGVLLHNHYINNKRGGWILSKILINAMFIRVTRVS